MEKSLLFINRSEDQTPFIPVHDIMNKALHADKETLLQIVSTLLDNNAALRKYIDLLERECKIR